MSNKGVEILAASIDKYKFILKIRLGSEGPARMPLMKIALDATKKSVKVKVRKHPAEHRKFLDAYFAEMVSTGLFKVCPTAAWQAAPHLVPKDSKSKYRTTIDLRPVNAATKPEQ